MLINGESYVPMLIVAQQVEPADVITMSFSSKIAMPILSEAKYKQLRYGLKCHEDMAAVFVELEGQRECQWLFQADSDVINNQPIPAWESMVEFYGVRVLAKRHISQEFETVVLTAVQTPEVLQTARVFLHYVKNLFSFENHHLELEMNLSSESRLRELMSWQELKSCEKVALKFENMDHEMFEYFLRKFGSIRHLTMDVKRKDTYFKLDERIFITAKEAWFENAEWFSLNTLGTATCQSLTLVKPLFGNEHIVNFLLNWFLHNNNGVQHLVIKKARLENFEIRDRVRPFIGTPSRDTISTNGDTTVIQTRNRAGNRATITFGQDFIFHAEQ